MFYYHNPLTFPSGAPRLPSLELPFSSTQPCKNFLIIFQSFRFFRRLFLSEPYDGEHLEIHHEFGLSFWDLAMNSFYGLLEIRTSICPFLISYFPLLILRPSDDLPLWFARRSVPPKKTEEEQNDVLSPAVGGEQKVFCQHKIYKKSKSYNISYHKYIISYIYSIYNIYY